ncbi:MAG: ArnT family glycosyltransferase, partial [Desulfobulbales bacterium]
TPLDLIMDEAYYWDWGRIPALGYYSKPPMIAWINWLTTSLFVHPTAFSVRLPAVILGTLSLTALYGFVQSMFDRKTAFWTVVLAALTPFACALNFVITTDAPLVCCWSFALYTTWQALSDERRQRMWWLLTGLVCGIGILSKQMMLFFPPLTLLYLLISKEDRPWLKTIWPYVCLLLAYAFLLLPIWWNMNNDGITFQHTAQHFEGNQQVFSFLLTLGEYVGGQILLMSPLPVILLIAIALGMVKHFFRSDRRIKFLLMYSAFPLAIIAILSLRQRINANWPAVYYQAGYALVAAWACQPRIVNGIRPGLRRLFPAAVYSGLCLTILTYFLAFFVAFSWLGGGKYDPTARLRGWARLGDKISALIAHAPVPSRIFLVADQRQTVSEMAFYVDNQPRVYEWNSPGGFVQSQYDLWPGPDDKIGWDSIIVLRNGRTPAPELQQSFREMKPLTEIRIPLGKAGAREYSVYLGVDLLRWRGR